MVEDSIKSGKIKGFASWRTFLASVCELEGRILVDGIKLRKEECDKRESKIKKGESPGRHLYYFIFNEDHQDLTPP